PFIRLGMPAVEAAARNGVPYVDSTGEQQFMADVYEKFSDASVPIVPACAFDYIPGDLTAAIAMADLGSEVSEVAVHTQASPIPSRGTARTTVEMAEALSSEARVRRVPFPDKVRTGVEFPFGDVPLARHAGGARVGGDGAGRGPRPGAVPRRRHLRGRARRLLLEASERVAIPSAYVRTHPVPAAPLLSLRAGVEREDAGQGARPPGRHGVHGPR